MKPITAVINVHVTIKLLLWQNDINYSEMIVTTNKWLYLRRNYRSPLIVDNREMIKNGDILSVEIYP